MRHPLERAERARGDPFNDGNGRVGRLPIVLQLYAAKVLGGHTYNRRFCALTALEELHRRGHFAIDTDCHGWELPDGTAGTS